MEDYLLFIDVSGDIDESCEQNKQIKFVPMEFLLKNQLISYTERSKFDFDNFYNFIKKGEVIKTSQITPSYYVDFFEPYLKEGKSVLYLCLSSGLSATYESSVKAAEQLNEKYQAKFRPVDSHLATVCLGLLAEKMIENKKNGLTLEENALDLEKERDMIEAYAVVDDLKALKRGGRISSTVAFFGGLLGIKPIITFKQGKLDFFDKERGLKNAFSKIIGLCKEHMNIDKNNTIYIADACEEQNLQLLCDNINKEIPNCIIKCTKLSPIIGAHLGSGAFVVTFFKK